MNRLMISMGVVFRFLLASLTVALIAFSPVRGNCETFTDDFNDPTTYMPADPESAPTKWRQIRAEFDNISEDTDARGPGDHAAQLSSNNEDHFLDVVALAANHAQYYDLSNVVAETEAMAHSVGAGIGLAVYDDTGYGLLAGIGLGFYFDSGYNSWVLAIEEGDKYDFQAERLGYTLLPPPDLTAFHTLRLEIVGDELTGTLDGLWVVNGTRNLPIDVAGIGLYANGLMDASYDNFSLTAQPDSRHTVFQDVDLVTTDPGADEVFPSWSRDSKRLAYMRRDPAAPGSWNVYVQQIDPPGPPDRRTQPADDVWIYSIPEFSRDFTHVTFTARNPEGGLSIKRTTADGAIGPVDTLLYGAGVNYEVQDISGSHNLLVYTREPHGGMANLSAIEVENDGSLADGAVEMPLTNFSAGMRGAWGAHFDSTGDRLAFISMDYGPDPRDSDIYVLNGVQAILADPASAPDNYSDPRLVPIAVGPNFQATPRFSADGSLVYYCEDVNGVFDIMYMEQNASLPWLDLMDGAHWEIFAADSRGLEDTIKLNYYRPYSQGVLDVSPDGTKLVFVSDKLDDGDAEEDSDLYIVTLMAQDRVKANKDTTLIDGSGTTLYVPADSLEANTTISIKTPFPGDIPSLETLPGGLQNLALARIIDSDKKPATIDPDNPPILTIHYTDEEISGLDEMSLRIYVFNEDAVPPFWEAIPMDCDVCGVDPVANTVTGTLTHLSTFCVSGALAGTLPAVGSFRPPLTNEEDFALQYGTALPVKFDIRNPAGEFLLDEPIEAVITDASSDRIATFVRGGGSEDIRVDPVAEQYHFNLHSKNYGLLEGTVYTIVILWNDIPIGDIDFTVDYTRGVGRGKKK